MDSKNKLKKSLKSNTAALWQKYLIRAFRSYNSGYSHKFALFKNSEKKKDKKLFTEYII
jgi:hypothetical protein